MSSARDRYADVLPHRPPVGESGLIGTALEALGRLAAESGDLPEAHRLFSEASALRRSSARPAPPHERRDLETATAALSTASAT